MITAGEMNDLFCSLFLRARRRSRGDISKLSRPTEMVFYFFIFSLFLFVDDVC